MSCGCCKPCCPTLCCPVISSSGAPCVAGTWNLLLSQIVRQAAGPDVTCASIEDVTVGSDITMVFTQCDKPNDVFVLAVVTAAPLSSPVNTGDQLLGVFRKDSKKCWLLKLVSPVDNTTFELTFVGSCCPKKFNFIYFKPVDASNPDFSAVGAGCGTKV